MHYLVIKSKSLPINIQLLHSKKLIYFQLTAPAKERLPPVVYKKRILEKTYFPQDEKPDFSTVEIKMRERYTRTNPPPL